MRVVYADIHSNFLPVIILLQWRHNGRDGFSNHQHQDCLLNRLFRRRSKKTSKLRVTGLCEGNSPVNSPHKGTVTRKCFRFMTSSCLWGFLINKLVWMTTTNCNGTWTESGLRHNWSELDRPAKTLTKTKQPSNIIIMHNTFKNKACVSRSRGNISVSLRHSHGSIKCVCIIDCFAIAYKGNNTLQYSINHTSSIGLWAPLAILWQPKQSIIQATATHLKIGNLYISSRATRSTHDDVIKFSALLAICAGNSPVPGEFPAQRLVTRSFDVFFDLHPNKRLSRQWWG